MGRMLETKRKWLTGKTNSRRQDSVCSSISDDRRTDIGMCRNNNENALLLAVKRIDGYASLKKYCLLFASISLKAQIRYTCSNIINLRVHKLNFCIH